MEHFTAQQLEALARESVSDKTLDELLKDKFFQQFARTFHFMVLAAAVSKDRTQFGHYFMLSDQNGESVEVNIEVGISAKIAPKV